MSMNDGFLDCYSREESKEDRELRLKEEAAPDLYAALESIVADLPQRCDWLDPAVEQMARAALAKARGEGEK